MRRVLWLSCVVFVLLTGLFAHFEAPAMSLACLMVALMCAFTFVELADTPSE